MKKIRKFLCAVLAMTMVFSLAACGGNGGGTPASNPPAANSTPAENNNQGGGEQVTLNWAIWDKDSTAYWQALADGYMKTHENVKIEMTDLGSSDYRVPPATPTSSTWRCWSR